MSNKSLAVQLAAIVAATERSPVRLSGTIGGKSADEHLKQVLAQMSESAADPKALEAATRLVSAANAGATEAVTALNALRVETTSNLLLPELRIVPSFFEVVSLADSDRPVWQNETREEITVRTVSQDGRRAVHQRLVKPQTEVLIDLVEIATDPVRYPIRDAVLGSVQVANAARSNLDLARDLAAQLDRLALTLVQSSFGTWSYTAGARQDRVAVPHSYIQSANLPTSNNIVLDSATLDAMRITRSGRVVNAAGTGLRQEVFDAITWYLTAWGEAKPAGAALVPEGTLLVPSADVVSISNSLTLDGAKGSDIAEAIKSDGFARIPWLGRTWTLVPSATLAPGALLVPFQKKMGVLFTKGSLDWEDTKTDVRNNFEERAQGKTFALYVPSHHRPFGLRVVYRT